MAKYVAKPFVAGSPDAMVIGQTMQAFLENVEADVIEPILKEQGVTEIKVDEWYPHQLWMDILRAIDNKLGTGANSAFVAFGRKVVQKAVMPPEMNTIPAALEALHAIHHMNLQNIPEDEGYITEKVDDNHYLIYENTPNPSETIYGFIWGICARFKQPGEQFTVRIIDNPNPKEKPGTLFDVTWG